MRTVLPLLLLLSVCLFATFPAAQEKTPSAKRKDPQSEYEPRSKPGEGQKFLQKFVGDWKVAKTFHPRSGEPVRQEGECRQTMINGGRFLQSDFVFHGDEKTTGTGLIGFEPAAGLFTSVWIDSRSTRMSFRQGQEKFDGQQIVLYSRALGDDGKKGRGSRTVTRLEDDGHRIVHRQYTAGEGGRERLAMELVLTKKDLPSSGAAPREGITVDKAEKTSNGFTLYTLTDGAKATLIDMRGNVVHRWEKPFRRVWTQAPHVQHPLPDDQIHWFHCYLYPNGDLLAIYHADGDTPYGYGLVKLDKDSKLLWAYGGRVHHDLDVDEDGTIYTLTQKLESKPPAGMNYLPVPYLADSLVVLSPEGQERESIPITEAFAKSPYALALAAGSKSPKPMNFPRAKGVPPLDPLMQPDGEGDLLHANSVKVLSRTLAAKFPLFKPGQVLLSLRNIDTIAVLDRRTRRVAWASQGVWRKQLDAEFLDNGHLLVYDNLGLHNDTRILEYDPVTQAVPWAYTNEHATHFSANFRGMKQHLPNGNTFIVDPDNRRLFEVTPDKELVWENYCSLPSAPPGQRPRSHAVNFARRYGADKLTFLKDVARARP